MYLDKQLQTYLDDLASAQATPGGGSAAALSGAMGAGLACMVARLTLGKRGYAEVQPEIEVLLGHAELLRQRFQQFMQEDIEAYGNLSACFKMPRSSDEERAARTKALQEALYAAALVPLAMMECAAELTCDCERLAQIGNANVISDIATATMMAIGAATGASWMVRTNLSAIKEQALVRALSERQQAALEAVEASRQRVISSVGERA